MANFGSVFYIYERIINLNTEPKSTVIWITPYSKYEKVNHANDLSVTAILV